MISVETTVVRSVTVEIDRTVVGVVTHLEIAEYSQQTLNHLDGIVDKTNLGSRSILLKLL